MRASKENAAKAQAHIDELEKLVGKNGTASRIEAIRFLRDFVGSAHKKLPREASFIKDEQRAAS